MKLRSGLSRSRDIIAQHRASETTLREAAALEPLAPTEEAVPEQVAAISSDRAGVLKAMATCGCPVCSHLAETAFAFFARWQCDLSSNEQTQRVFADELGFCPLHTWQLADLSSVLGLCTGYPRLLERLAGEFSALAASTQDAPDSPAWLREHAQTCRVCSVLRNAEEQFIARTATVLLDSAGQQAYAASQGVCLRHLGLLLAKAETLEVKRFLLAETGRHFEQWAEDMQSYAIKRDALRRGLQNPDEDDAHQFALVHSRRTSKPLFAAGGIWFGLSSRASAFPGARPGKAAPTPATQRPLRLQYSRIDRPWLQSSMILLCVCDR